MKTNTKTKTMATLTKQLDDLRPRVTEARRALIKLGAQGLSQVEKHPVGAVVGAFATGIAVAKLVSRG